jgi:Protein of unknown function (DUF2911)
MKIVYFLSLLLMFHTIAAQQRITNPNAIVDTFKKSIPCMVKGKIGAANVEIGYYSPGVKNRIIWGGLVPYDAVWVTGAHSATRITINRNFIIGSKKVKAGAYAIFTIPGKNKWIFILNKNYDQHLTDDYNAADDIVRLEVVPLPINKNLERLQYFIEKGKLVIAWEKIKIEIPLQTL